MGRDDQKPSGSWHGGDCVSTLNTSNETAEKDSLKAGIRWTDVAFARIIPTSGESQLVDTGSTIPAKRMLRAIIITVS